MTLYIIIGIFFGALALALGASPAWSVAIGAGWLVLILAGIFLAAYVTVAAADLCDAILRRTGYYRRRDRAEIKRAVERAKARRANDESRASARQQARDQRWQDGR